MRGMLLKPSEYSILRAILPSVAVLNCKKYDVRFKTFWDLPVGVREYVAVYTDTPDRFEIYQGEEGPGHLLVLACFGEESDRGNKIEFMGEWYASGGTYKFIPEPQWPISKTMVQKAEAMASAPWSWSLIPESDNVAWWQLLLGVTSVLLWSELLFRWEWVGSFMSSLPLQIRGSLVICSIFLFIIGNVLGLVLPIIQVAYSWWQHHAYRRTLSKELVWFKGGVVMG